jgi:hypothetical protein
MHVVVEMEYGRLMVWEHRGVAAFYRVCRHAARFPITGPDLLPHSICMHGIYQLLAQHDLVY